MDEEIRFMARRSKNVPLKGQLPKKPKEDVWAKERKAIADGTVRPRGRPKKVPVAPPPELVEAVQKAEGADALIKTIKGIATASLKAPGTPGYIEPKVAKVLLDCAKETRQVQMRLKAKEGTGIVAGAFEMLTKQEREVVETYRASKRVPSLKPGETPPPPPMDEPEPKGAPE